MPQRIMVTGAAGMLGSALVRVLDARDSVLRTPVGVGADLQVGPPCEVWGLSRRAAPPGFPSERWLRTDLTDPDRTYAAITRVNPDLVIHTASMTDVDACETQPEEAYRQNGLAARNVALACQRFDTALCAISTDYVFDGRKGGPYDETDAVNPSNVYGRSKLWGEEFIRGLLAKAYIVRTAWLFGASRDNFVTNCVARARAGQEIRLATDFIGSPTYVDDLAKGLVHLVRSGLYGTYHLTNAGWTTRHAWGEFVLAEAGELNARIRPLALADLHLPAARPPFVALRNMVWELHEWPLLPPWQDAVKRFLKVARRGRPSGRPAV